MFSKATIEKVEDLDLVAVIGRFVDLKKSGASYSGKSPFTDEKTGSFYVSPGKGLWKCFSSGNGGNNPISFIMKLKRIPFPEAIHELSEMFNIEIEYDKEKGEKYLEQGAEKLEIQEVNQMALEFWWKNLFKDEERTQINNLDPEALSQIERANIDQLQKFNIGYASDSYTELKDYLVGKGVSLQKMIKAGLIKEKRTENGIMYNDFFRARLMFPIYNLSGKLVGFSGRDVKNVDKKYKVFNSPETPTFQKSKHLLGLSVSKLDISSANEVIKVEGNFDVTALHEKGLTNTVATLGSAFTPEQVAQLRKLCNRIVLAIDNDKAGIGKVEHDIRLLLEHGFTVRVWMSDVNGEDPFDFVKRNQKKSPEKFISLFNSMCVDGLSWIADRIFENTNGDIVKTSEAQNHLSNVLACVKDGTLRNNYIKHFVKEREIDKKQVEEQIRVADAELKAKLNEKNVNNGFNLPHYLPEEEIENFPQYRFYGDPTPKKCGYYFANREGEGFRQVSNCTIRPLFKVRHVSDSVRIAEVKMYLNEKEINRLVEIPNKAFFSQGELESVLTNIDCYFHGSKQDFQKLTVKLMKQFTECSQIRTLGWQKAGFFAFSNGIIDNGFKPINKYGICIHEGTNYFLPAFSAIYSDVPLEDDPYENDRTFVYKDSGATFKQWSSLFHKVYQDRNNGMFGIAFLMATLFSDHIYLQNNSAFPMLFGFGLPGTGKSTMGRSMSRVFKAQANEFNLNQGTPIALARRLSRSRNVMEHLDEYQNDLDEKRFQSLKGIFDRTGHEKGVLSRDNRTETTKINCSAYVSGQYMPTRDGNSMFTRSILLTFEKGKEKYTKAELEDFSALTKMEDSGLSSLVAELVKYRSLVEEQYGNVQFEIQSLLKEDMREQQTDGRVMQNFTVLNAIVKLLGEKVGLPFSFNEFYNQSKEMILAQSAILSDSNQLSEFFKLVQFLILERKLENGADFKISVVNEVTVREGSKGSRTVMFNEPTKLIHFNFSRTYPLYQQLSRSMNGQNGLPETTLKSYMKTHRGFVGTPPNVRFKNGQSTAYTFDLSKLGIDLDLEESNESGGPISNAVQTGNFNTPGMNGSGWPDGKEEDDLPF